MQLSTDNPFAFPGVDTMGREYLQKKAGRQAQDLSLSPGPAAERVL